MERHAIFGIVASLDQVKAVGLVHWLAASFVFAFVCVCSPASSVADLAKSSSSSKAKQGKKSIEQRTLRRHVKWALRTLRWIQTYGVLSDLVQPIIRSLEELDELLDIPQRSAETERKVAQLQKRLKELERIVASMGRDGGESRKLKQRIGELRRRLNVKSNSYKTCGTYNYRLPNGRCQTKR